MSDVNEIVELAENVKEFTVENLETIKEKLQSIVDNPTDLIRYATLAKPLKNFIKEKAPFLYPSWQFWDNVDKFFNSGILNDNDKKKLIDKLSSDKNKNKVGKKIIGIIEKVETDKKLVYIINATKSLVDDKIEFPIYFRICHTISQTLEEDLQFLNNHIDKKAISYSIEVNGLIASGLAYNRGIGENDAPSYAFNEFAKVVNEYALKGDGQKRIEEFNLNKPPQTTFLTTNDIANEEDVQKMFEEIFSDNSK